tara:strand:+ start:1892 stop:2836 length:945 start_codon:yes stop_codon:yes gene_type:complete
MKRVAFIIPAWEGDFPKLRDSLNSFLKCQKDGDSDIVVVMSKSEEIEKFKIYSSLNFGKLINFISLDCFTKGNNSKEDGIINAKKFYGLQFCIDSNHYEYMIPIDCENKFIDLTNIKEVCKNIYDRKSFYGGKCKNDKIGKREEKINLNCISFLKKYCDSENPFSKIDTSIFFFWYDLPVYKKSIAISFLDFIDFKDTSKLSKNLKWTHFDHILFGYYCCAYHNHLIVETKFHERGIVKRASKDLFIKIKEEFGISLSWTSYNHYNKRDSCFDNVKILYHTDKKIKKIKRFRSLRRIKEIMINKIKDLQTFLKF